MHLITRPLLEALKFANLLSYKPWCINPLLEIKLNNFSFIQLSQICNIEDCIFIATSVNSIRIFEGLSLSFDLSKIKLVTNSKAAYQAATILGINASVLPYEDLQTFTQWLVNTYNIHYNLVYLSGDHYTMPIAQELQKYNLNAIALTVYYSIPRGFIESTIANIREEKIDSISLFSARTAQIFLQEIKLNNLEKYFSNIDIWVISSKVAKIITAIKAKKIYIISDLSSEITITNLKEFHYD